jgi:hypothetical protein
MSTLRAKGQEIERLVNEQKLTNPKFNYEELCRLTEDLVGDDVEYVAIKTLRKARRSEHVTVVRLNAIARVLGVEDLKEIAYLTEEESFDSQERSADQLSDLGQERTFVFNVPAKFSMKGPAAALNALPPQLALNFLDAAIRLIAPVQSSGASIEEKRNDLIEDIANAQLASQLDKDDHAQAPFKGTRNPTREKRLEKNIRSIIEKAVKFFDLSLNPPKEKIDQTFLDYFLEYGQKVSDPQGQDLWAEILAAKVQRPEGLSLKTLRVMQDLDYKVAQQFVKFCNLVFEVDGHYISIRLHKTERYLAFATLSFDDVLALDDYGLVSLGLRDFRTEIGSTFVYFKRAFQALEHFEFKANALTRAGSELFRLVKLSSGSKGYFDAVCQQFGNRVRIVGLNSSREL